MTDRPNCITGGKVTIKDISAKLGISSTTVHRALAGKEGMTDALRQKIWTLPTRWGMRQTMLQLPSSGELFGSLWCFPRTMDATLRIFGKG